MTGAQAGFLPDGRRLHLHHGPIDLIVDVAGPGRADALRRAEARFATILSELVQELPLLRTPVDGMPRPHGRVARRMHAAVQPFASDCVTPMAAVAGAVADAVLAAACGGPGIATAYVNNGGDVALHIAPGHSLTAAIAAGPGGRVRLGADSAVRGIATSGWGGRSHSLGIADAVTVLATGAAQADAAATLIANAVDLPGHPGIARRPARDLSPDSDLGARPVTVGVAPLTPGEIGRALAAGADYASRCAARGLILAACLTLQGTQRIAGDPAAARLLPTDPEKDPCHA